MQSLQFVDGAGDINIAIDGVVRYCLFRHSGCWPDFNVTVFDIRLGGNPIKLMLGDSYPPHALMADLARNPRLFHAFAVSEQRHAEERRMQLNRLARRIEQANVESQIIAGRVEKARLRASLRRRA